MMQAMDFSAPETVPSLDAQLDQLFKVVKKTERRELNLLDWTANRYLGRAPERTWLIDGVLPAGVAGVVAAMGDTGKSMLLLDLALQVASFTDGDVSAYALGGYIRKGGTAVILTAEDDAREIHERLNNLDKMQRRGYLGDRLIVVPLPSTGGPFPLIRQVGDQPETTPEYESLKAQLLQIPDLALVIIDPMQAFIMADINKDPSASQFVCSIFANLATETGANVLFAHHMSKRGEIEGPAQAREAVRGSSAIVDGVRWVYALWPATVSHAKSLCKKLDTKYIANKIVMGSVVKANGPADRTMRTYIRNEFGLLVDSTERVKKLNISIDQLKEKIMEAIQHYAEKGSPFSRSGANTLWTRAHLMGPEYAKIDKYLVERTVKDLLAEGDIVACRHGSAKADQWLDVPGGPFAVGNGDFVPGATEPQR